MVNARDFGGDKTPLAVLTSRWLRDLNRLGGLERELASTDRGNPRWSKLQHAASALRLELADRAARAEVEAQRHREMVAEREM